MLGHSEKLYPPSSVYSSPRRSISGRSTIIQIEDPVIEEIQKAREERRTTGRFVAVIVALSLILLSCYHAWIRRTAVLASVIIPALIMVLYTAWVLYSAKRDKYRRNLAMQNGMPLFLTSVFTMGSTRTFGSVSVQKQLDNGKQVEDQKRRRPRKRRRGARKILISEEYRNVVIQEIPPFNREAVEALGSSAVTHNITHPCSMEMFEEDPDIVRQSHLVMCRSHSVS